MIEHAPAALSAPVPARTDDDPAHSELAPGLIASSPGLAEPAPALIADAYPYENGTLIEDGTPAAFEAFGAGSSDADADADANVSGWAGSARRYLAPVVAVLALLGRAGRAVAHAWSRSLQLRVAVTTVLISGIVVLIVGIFLVDQISGGVLRDKRSAAIAQVDSGMVSARAALGQTNFADVQGVVNAVSNLRGQLALSSDDAGLYRVVIKSELTDVQREALGDVFDADPVPDALQQLVQQGRPAAQYAGIQATRGGPMVPGLVVGEAVHAQGGMYEIYYLFPLTVEQDTIALVQRTVLLAGLGLVLFVAMIAMLVTRQVVRPVRVAARTAARVAGGDLSQRIRVSGSDDIARLGQSFNEMAGSLQQQIQQLEQLSRLQRQFTSDVSHELRTPLTTIRMASEMLYTRRGDFPPQVARSAELLQAELDRFEGLLADLLEISRYDAGVARLETEHIDLRSVVTRVVEAHRLLAARNGSEMIMRMPSEPVIVEIDSRRVERILRNLIGNALDYGEGRRVEVSVADDEDAAAVTVRDHGAGLRPGEVDFVFDRFWRGDPSRSRLTGGTGLGLAISLEDARQHGGWLQAWGQKGAGAQFRLTLPRRAGGALTSSPLPLEPADAVAPRGETAGTRG